MASSQLFLALMKQSTKYNIKHFSIQQSVRRAKSGVSQIHDWPDLQFFMWVCRYRLKVCFHINMENPASFYTLILTSLKSVWWFHAEKSIWTCQRRHLCLFPNSNGIRKKIYTNQSLLCWAGFPHFLQRVWMTNCLLQLEHSELFADGYYILVCTYAKLRRQERSSTELKGDIKHLET